MAKTKYRVIEGNVPVEDVRIVVSELEAELHAIKYEIMGGEDVPGSASAAAVEDVRKEVSRLRSIELAARGLAERIYRSE